MGYSQGGGVALQFALRHRERIGKLISLSATFRRDGWYPAEVQVLEPMITAFLDDAPPANPSLW